MQCDPLVLSSWEGAGQALQDPQGASGFAEDLSEATSRQNSSQDPCCFLDVGDGTPTSVGQIPSPAFRNGEMSGWRRPWATQQLGGRVWGTPRGARGEMA